MANGNGVAASLMTLGVVVFLCGLLIANPAVSGVGALVAVVGMVNVQRTPAGLDGDDPQ